MSIIDIIIGTPIWVWIVLGYLLIAGIKATYPTTAPLWKLSIMPTVLLCWGFYSIYLKCIACFPLFILWACMITVGILFGQFLIRKTSFTFDKNTQLFQMPGSWVPLLLSCAFFIVKYVMGATYALVPAMKTNLILMSIDVALSALIAGIAWGQFTVQSYTHYRDTHRSY
jgi:hypothetical protein